MDADRWRQIQNVYLEAVATAPRGRLAFLDRACGDDAGLRREVLSLLAADTHVDPVLHASLYDLVLLLEDDGEEPGSGRMGP